MGSENPLVLYYTESEEEKRIVEEFFINYETIDCTGLEEKKLDSIISGEIEKASHKKWSSNHYSFMIFHKMESKEILEILKHIRQVSKSEWIFATTTENNLNWVLKDLLKELIEEHRNMHNIR
ncbi:hypothetical protein AT15_06875 [Kosmotoga arenicorallina S304]|uniref:DUF3783 domain-containing protein n=1 Tax=Kosmotoga arenicorallina S304 TaxID=1453497 RepID=A0A182C715_9BACT|nr:DUF3783 domain-containing protein [Kosmotoga arenicorallina]OAA31214.1 hypothetical protein AT15_06875 [Kosmotoga arenicorallina S304]